jgi:hypothetical protein
MVRKLDFGMMSGWRIAPLKIKFPRLFRISRQQDWSVSDLKEVDWDLDLRR